MGGILISGDAKKEHWQQSAGAHEIRSFRFIAPASGAHSRPFRSWCREKLPPAPKCSRHFVPFLRWLLLAVLMLR